MKILSTHFNAQIDTANRLRSYTILKHLSQRGHEIYLVNYFQKSSNNNLPCIRYFDNDVCEEINYSLPYRILRNFLKNDFDIVIGNTHYGALFATPGKLFKKPVYFDMHGGLVEECVLDPSKGFRRINYFTNLLIKKAINHGVLYLSNKIVCVSKTMMDYLVLQGIPQEKLLYLTNGVDLDFFSSQNINKTESISEQLQMGNAFIFGYIGAFQKYQGVDYLIEAAQNYHRKDVKFLFVGSKPQGLSASDNMIFIPKQPRNCLPDYYSLCDVLVLPRPLNPATNIAAPTKFAEYCAMGKPILSTRVGDPANLMMQYNNGYIMDNLRSESFIDAFETIRNTDARELRTMGLNSRKLAEQEFNWDKNIQSLAISIEKNKQ